jgi:hypothetical protein
MARAGTALQSPLTATVPRSALGTTCFFSTTLEILHGESRSCAYASPHCDVRDAPLPVSAMLEHASIAAADKKISQYVG